MPGKLSPSLTSHHLHALPLAKGKGGFCGEFKRRKKLAFLYQEHRTPLSGHHCLCAFPQQLLPKDTFNSYKNIFKETILVVASLHLHRNERKTVFLLQK